MKKDAFILMLFLFAACSSGRGLQYDGDSRYNSFAPDGIEFRVGDKSWKQDMRGNHRAVVTVSDYGVDAVSAILPWRRPDLRQETKKIIVTDSDDKEIKDVIVTSFSPESGEIIFRPVKGEHNYYVYYMPYKYRFGYSSDRYADPKNEYLPPVYEADAQWAAAAEAAKGNLPQARVEYFESWSRFDFWSPMGLIATKQEEEALLEASDDKMMVFPEDRAFPIQLRNNLPSRWNSLPSRCFNGYAQRNEYYCWQLGVWAAREEARHVDVTFSDFRNGSSVIPAGQLTCFNTEGVDTEGKHFDIDVSVPMGHVQALWCGIQVPMDAKRGKYKGTAVVSAEGIEPQTIDIVITVSSDVLADSGDSQEWRHSRLRWLNSTIAQDNQPTKDFDEMTVDGNVIGATGREVTLSDNGLVQSISFKGKEIFEKGPEFILTTDDGDISFTADNLAVKKEDTGLVTWTSSSRQGPVNFELFGRMEFDGFIHYDLKVSADSDIEVRDVKLVSNYSAYSSEYFMGAGFKGGYRPETLCWDWTGPFDSYWIGGPLAGLHFEFLGGTYHGPLLNDYYPEPTPVWNNAGKGRVTLNGGKGKGAAVVASTGGSIIGKEARNYEFDMLVTPTKEINTAKHFSERYHHSSLESFEESASYGGNIINIHHASSLNPYINYPFVVKQPLKEYIIGQHDKNRKVKLYYTVRELTTHCEEVYAFHSLNGEIYDKGPGYGLPWECEHLVDDYRPAWYTDLSSFGLAADASLATAAQSRFINYWLEGLRWMEENYDLDGIYMDDVSFDRRVVKRIRKILDRYHDGALIDLHCCEDYSVGPANQYTDFFPYVDRLWLGERFYYDKMSPDCWFVTCSGIPFGQMSEMLEGGGNPYLGMIYGTSGRYHVEGSDKRVYPVWKLWDDFGIGDSRMVGYWDENPVAWCDDPEVKVTCYVKEDKTLIVIGNFSLQDKSVSLTIDYKSLGLDPQRTVLHAPEMFNGLQPERTFSSDGRITVKSKKAWMIVVSPAEFLAQSK